VRGGTKFDFFFENFKIIANSHDARWMDDAKKKSENRNGIQMLMVSTLRG
jgi:hypothetical protein